MTLYQDCPVIWIRQKTWPPGGRGLFSLYIYIENLKNLFVNNHCIDFNIILQQCSFGILYQDCSSHLYSSKHMASRGRGLFSLYIYIENLKKMSSCHKPLNRFPYNFAETFLLWSSTKIVQAIWIRQNSWPPGGGAYFPYIIYIEDLKKSFY